MEERNQVLLDVDDSEENTTTTELQESNDEIVTDTPSSLLCHLSKIVLPFSLAGGTAIGGSFINAIIISKLGDKFVAASGLISFAQTFVITIPSVLFFAAGSMIGQAYGKKKYHHVAVIYQQSLLLGAMMSVPAITLLEFSEPILNGLGQENNLTKITQDYFHGYVFAVPAMFWIEACRQLLLGISKPMTMLGMTVVNTALTTGLTYILVLGKLGLPSYGIRGAAYADAISFTLTFFGTLLFFRFNKSFSKYKIFGCHFKKSLKFLKELCSIGLPISLQLGFDSGIAEIITLLAGRLGTNSLIIKQVVTQYSSLFMLPFLTIAQSSSVINSQFIGKKQFHDVRCTGNITVIMGLGLGAIGFILYTSIPEKLVSTFIDLNNSMSEEIITLAKPALVMAGTTLAFDGARYTLGGSLRAFYDTGSPLMASIIGSGLIGITTAYVSGIVFEKGLPAIMGSQAIGTIVTTGILVGRWAYVTGNSIRDGEAYVSDTCTFGNLYNKVATFFNSCKNIGGGTQYLNIDNSDDKSVDEIVVSETHQLK